VVKPVVLVLVQRLMLHVVQVLNLYQEVYPMAQELEELELVVKEILVAMVVEDLLKQEAAVVVKIQLVLMVDPAVVGLVEQE
tara:strand:- start:263 stop:508 length:246 start_codon:yes stop_codon:yes gene_type:complete